MNANEPVVWNYNDNNLEPNTITFNNVNSDGVMQITADRKIIVNEDVEVSEAAQTVLDAMQPLLLKANPVKELTSCEFENIIDACDISGDYDTQYDFDKMFMLLNKTILRKASEK